MGVHGHGVCFKRAQDRSVFNHGQCIRMVSARPDVSNLTPLTAQLSARLPGPWPAASTFYCIGNGCTTVVVTPLAHGVNSTYTDVYRGCAATRANSRHTRRLSSHHYTEQRYCPAVHGGSTIVARRQACFQAICYANSVLPTLSNRLVRLNVQDAAQVAAHSVNVAQTQACLQCFSLEGDRRWVERQRGDPVAVDLCLNLVLKAGLFCRCRWHSGETDWSSYCSASNGGSACGGCKDASAVC